MLIRYVSKKTVVCFFQDRRLLRLSQLQALQAKINAKLAPKKLTAAPVVATQSEQPQIEALVAQPVPPVLPVSSVPPVPPVPVATNSIASEIASTLAKKRTATQVLCGYLKQMF